ncbi:MAG: ROK family protein, partial [Candidatus Omnitrophica bacterium]|nr:ROK family protein [Candidatus Omnitrophota bacterium]
MKKHFIGVDVGGTKISAALVDTSGKVVARAKTATPVKA